MRRTIQLFQLLIIIFAGYGYFHFSEEIRLNLLLGCMVVTYILEKMDTLVLDKQKLQKLLKEKKIEHVTKKKSFTPLNTLMEDKTTDQLREAIKRILKKLRFVVASPKQAEGVDFEFWTPGSKSVLGLKVFDSVGDLEQELLDVGPPAALDEQENNHRVVFIAGNIDGEGDAEEIYLQDDFSPKIKDFLQQNRLLAMTTSTLREIYLVCSKRRIDPRLFLRHFQEHAGGVFRMEDLIEN